MAIVCVSVILLVSLWGLLRPASDPSDAQPPFVTTPAGPAKDPKAAAAPAPPTTARAAPKDVTVTLRYAGASWTRVTADGRVAFEGTPGSRQRRTFKARRSLELILGYPAGVRLTVNGRDLGVPDRSGNIWRRSSPRAAGRSADRGPQKRRMIVVTRPSRVHSFSGIGS